MSGDVEPSTDRTEPLFRATTQEDESVAQMLALLDVQDALPSARRLHDWAIELAAVRPGDQVVDLGNGTGTISRSWLGWCAVQLDRSPAGLGHRRKSAGPGLN